MNVDEALMADIAGFKKSRAILTAVELDLFTRLDESPAPAAELASGTGTDERALTRLMDCLLVFGLLEKENGRYRLTGTGAHLSSRHPASVLPMALHQNALWRNWSFLTDVVKHGTNPELDALTDDRSDIEQNAFIGAMHVIGRTMAREITSDLDLTRYRCLLDIGGGSGTYSIAFLESNPQLKAVIFDLESVIPLARDRLAKAGLLDRADIVPGDFYTDDLPPGADLALLSAIIHQNDPEQDLALYRKIHAALEPGGALLIRDYFMDPTRTRPPRGALFALNMLACTPGGDTYTFDEVKDRLERAGFAAVEQVRSGENMDAVVEARKPE